VEWDRHGKERTRLIKQSNSVVIPFVSGDGPQPDCIGQAVVIVGGIQGN